jgi:hypothetical protein
MHRTARLLRSALATTFFLLVAASSHAAFTTNHWNWGSGFWHHGTNWTNFGAATSLLPSTNDSLVLIQYPNPAIVTILPETAPANLTINELMVATRASTRSNWLAVVDLNHSNRVFRILSHARIGGRDNNRGQFIITNSTVIIDGSKGGTLTVSNGIVHVQDGGLLILTNGAEARIAHDYVGFVNIVGGTLRITDADFNIGTNSIGHVTVNGGLLDIGRTLSIGHDSSGTGTVFMAAGLLKALDTNSNTEVGAHGTGFLIVSNGIGRFDDISVGRHAPWFGTYRLHGGTNYASDVSMGRFVGSKGYFTNTGGNLIMSGYLYAGRESTGTIVMADGFISAQGLVVAQTNKTFGTATFLGGTSVFSGFSRVGSIGSTGIVLAAGSSSLICTNSTNTGVMDVIRGSLTISNGTHAFDTIVLTNTGIFRILGGTSSVHQILSSNGAPFVIGDGVNPVTVHLTGGSSVFKNGLLINTNATVVGSGALVGNVTNCGTLTASGGPIAIPGTFVNCNTTSTENGGTFRYTSPATNIANRIISIAPLGPDLLITYRTTNGFFYTPEYKRSFTDPFWIPLRSTLGNNLPASFQDHHEDDPRRIYRIRIQ